MQPQSLFPRAMTIARLSMRVQYLFFFQSAFRFLSGPQFFCISHSSPSLLPFDLKPLAGPFRLGSPWMFTFFQSWRQWPMSGWKTCNELGSNVFGVSWNWLGHQITCVFGKTFVMHSVTFGSLMDCVAQAIPPVHLMIAFLVFIADIFRPIIYGSLLLRVVSHIPVTSNIFLVSLFVSQLAAVLKYFSLRFKFSPLGSSYYHCHAWLGEVSLLDLIIL